MNMKITKQQVKEDIYNYKIIKATRDELLEKSKINAKMSQTYSDMPNAKGGRSDGGISREVFRRLTLEARIHKLNERLNHVDNSLHILDDVQKQVIVLIRDGYKMTQIASKLQCPRKKVVYIRDRAIHKLTVYLNQTDDSCCKQYFK